MTAYFPISDHFGQKLRKCSVSDFYELILINTLHFRWGAKRKVSNEPVCCCQATERRCIQTRNRSQRERCTSAAPSTYANESVIGESYALSEFREHCRLRSAYICIAAAMITEIRQGYDLASLTQFIQLNLLCFAKIKKTNKNHSSVDRTRQNSQGSLAEPQRRTGPTDSSTPLCCLTEFDLSRSRKKQPHHVNIRLTAESTKVCL